VIQKVVKVVNHEHEISKDVVPFVMNLLS